MVLGLVPDDLTKVLDASSGPAKIDAKDVNGTTPLMWAARRGDRNAVSILLDKGADLHVRNRFRQCALLNAARSRSLACIKLLIKAGARMTHTDNQGFNALHYAAIYSDDAEIVQYLIDTGAEVNGRDYQNIMPIVYAVGRNKYHTVRTLIDNGSDLDYADEVGDDVLHYTLGTRAKNVLSILLERGAPRVCHNSAKQSILHYAALYSDIETLELLVSAGLEGLDPDALDHKGKKPLQLAQEREDKAQGFADKLQELLSGIRTRNTTLNSSEESAARVGIREMTREHGATEDPFVQAQESQHRLRLHARLRSIKWPIWKSLLLYWLLGLGWAGFVYKLWEPGRAMKHEGYSAEYPDFDSVETCAWSYDGQA